MSAYQEYITELTDGPTLVAALIEFGFTPEVYDIPVPLFGIGGSERPERAHIVIRRGQVGASANDIGFVKENGVYRAIISEFDAQYNGHRMGAYNQSWLGRVAQRYQECKTMAIARAKGYLFQGRTEVAGNVTLKFGVR